MIAALYVQTGGVYYGLPDVDPWDEQRDARLYDGPWPVVAHPPCNRWVSYGAQDKRGEDEGCFASALASVRKWGGVLEHPARSQAWTAFGLPKPANYGWVSQLGDDGWAIEVDQYPYGFPTRKRTWLYSVGVQPVDLLVALKTPTRGCETLWSTERSKTPAGFRDVLLYMAAAAAVRQEGT
jgi:hypothetical protein